MHRHGYKGRKFGRERDQRKALMRGLAVSLINHHSIETTLPKAKDLRPFTEKLITKAKAGGLFNRRLLISRLGSVQAAHSLMDDIAPQLTARDSGYLRIKKTDLRAGDNTQMAVISFVDKLKQSNSNTDSDKAKAVTSEPVDIDKKTSTKKATGATAKVSTKTSSQGAKVAPATKRTGVRGNK